MMCREKKWKLLVYCFTIQILHCATYIPFQVIYNFIPSSQFIGLWFLEYLNTCLFSIEAVKDNITVKPIIGFISKYKDGLHNYSI